MAKRVTVYEAADGTRFDTLERADAHDVLAGVVAAAMQPLAEPPKGDFGNERLGYWQHNPAQVMVAKVHLVEIAAGIGMRWFAEHLREAADIHPMSYGGRVMSECGPSPLKDAWGRLCRIDELGREWEQVFFAVNPEKGCQHPYGQEPAGAEA